MRKKTNRMLEKREVQCCMGPVASALLSCRLPLEIASISQAVSCQCVMPRDAWIPQRCSSGIMRQQAAIPLRLPCRRRDCRRQGHLAQLPPPLVLAPPEAAAFVACASLQRALCSFQCAFWHSPLRCRRIQQCGEKPCSLAVVCYPSKIGHNACPGTPHLQYCASLYAPHRRRCAAQLPHPLHIRNFLPPSEPILLSM